MSRLNLKSLVFSIAVLASFQAHSETLLVSDIDDTIKISYVHGSQAKYENGFHFNNVFLGMPELYQKIARDSKVQFAYISNAVSFIMHYPQSQFLFYNSFPEGGMFLRQNPFDSSHKVSVISKLIEQKQPTQLILIGDNGERDTKIYAEIQKKFPQIPTQTFIHQVYSVKSKSQTGAPLEAGQTGFVTAVDLALQLTKAGLITEASSQELISTLVPEILAEKEGLYYDVIAIPAWMNCKDADFSEVVSSAATNPQMSAYVQKLQKRCR